MEQWIEVRRAVLVEGMSKRAACRRFGLHWETMQRILAYDSPPAYRRVAMADRPVIGPWLGRLAELIEESRSQPRKQRYTVKKMWELLCKDGFAGGYTTVKDAVRELRGKASKEVFMPLTQPPGEAQVDFGQALARIGGMLTKIHFFVMSLVHSDAMFVMAFARECTEALLEAHVAAFGFFGFVPGRISYDNTRTAVAQILGAHARTLTSAFERLVGHYLFEPHFCRVRRANEKGVVEGSVRSRQNFMVPVPDVADYTELNAYLRACCESDMDRRLRGKAFSKRQLLAEDKVAGLALRPGRFDARRLVSTTASSEALVRFETNDYSVPVAYGHRPVVLRASTETVFVYQAGKEIARHRRCWDRERQIFDPVHYLPLLERKSGSLDYARPLAGWALPECISILRRELEARREDGTREYIRVLLLLREHALPRVTRAVERSLHWSSPTADAIRQWLVPAERPELATFRLDGRDHLAGVHVAETSLSVYSRLREVAYA